MSTLNAELCTPGEQTIYALVTCFSKDDSIALAVGAFMLCPLESIRSLTRHWDSSLPNQAPYRLLHVCSPWV
jgi:hypothetical protein